MIKFISKIVCFCLIIFVADRGIGYCLMYMSEHAKGGHGRHHNYLINECQEEVLIFGSSRASRHYNPDIIKDSLNLSCYNCGQDGNGIILHYGWWQIIRERHKPKMIIYDVTSEFDLLEGDNQRFLGWLKEIYD